MEDLKKMWCKGDDKAGELTKNRCLVLKRKRNHAGGHNGQIM